MSSAAHIDLLEALPDAALIVDEDGCIEHMNSAAQELFGAPDRALDGQQIDRLLSESERMRYAAQRAIVFAASDVQAAPVPLRWMARRRDGREFPAEMCLRLLPGASEPRALAVVRDGSERQRLERALHDARRLQSEFFGHMSHELSTPLNGVIGFTEFLLDGKPGSLNESQHEYLNDILVSARRLQHLIEGVMELSQLEAGAAEIHVESFAIAAAIEEACAAVATAAQQKGVGLQRAIAPELQQVSLDRRRLLQVLQYVLTNAIKFSGPGRAICIEARAQGTTALQLRIRDSGMRMRSSALEQMMSDYPQLDSSAIRRFGGSGLDLVLAKKLVEAQSGVFSVENDSGRGGAFCLLLPCAAGHAVDR